MCVSVCVCVSVCMWVCVFVCVSEEFINHKEFNILINVLQCVYE